MDVEALRTLQSLLADFDLPSDFSADFIKALYELDEAIDTEVDRLTAAALFDHLLLMKKRGE